MTQREIIEQVERTFDTTAIEAFERARLVANRPPPPVREEARVIAPVVHVRRYSGIGLITVALGFIAVALAVLGAGLLIGDRLGPPISLAVLKDDRVGPRGSDAVTFHRQALGLFEVVTVWRYSGTQETFEVPSGQLCFVGPPHQPGLPIAKDGTPLDIDAALAARLDITPEDIDAALPLCTWFDDRPADDPADTTIEARAVPDSARDFAGS
jgi:hypothetical protein